MPKTPVRHAPRVTRSDPLQRTRSAVHLDLPPYTPQTRFFHSNLGEPNDVEATHDEIIVLSKTVEVARRILGSIRSEETTIDALMDVGGLALDETLGETPPVEEAPERDWIAKQVGDWLRGSNMVIYIDDDIDDYGMCVPLNAQKDLYISHNVRQFSALQNCEHMLIPVVGVDSGPRANDGRPHGVPTIHPPLGDYSVPRGPASCSRSNRKWSVLLSMRSADRVHR